MARSEASRGSLFGIRRGQVLLAGAKLVLPAGEIIKSVSTTCGHEASSLRTTLYNRKKTGVIVQGEDGLSHHPESVRQRPGRELRLSSVDGT